MGYHEQFFAECQKVVGDFTGKSVLIAGCGPGRDCIPFVAAGPSSITAMDIGDDLGVELPHPLVQYHRGSIEGCDLDSGQYDVVYSVATLEHVHNIEAAYIEMVRLARPGGVIYAFAAPLWNSRRGHHFDCLNPFPWIHLRLTQEELAALGDERAITHNGKPLREVVDWLYHSTYFNRYLSNRYIQACRHLPVSRMLQNDLWMDGAEDLTPEIASELSMKGYAREELLAVSHTLSALK
jgi:SAM-dependent methyltransferase